MLNYTPQVYEAIIAALIVVGLIQSFALGRKWHQAEKLKSTLESAMFGWSFAVAKAKAETRRVAEAADKSLDAAEDSINELIEQVETLREENQESRLDDVEQRLGDLEIPIRYAAMEPNKSAESRVPLTDSLGGLLASLGRNGLTPTGLTPTGRWVGGRWVADAPSIKAFKITPDGLVPVNGPEDFGISGLSTSTLLDAAPSLADILSAQLLATLPRSAFPPDFGAESSKADLSGGQRGTEPQTASPEHQTASPEPQTASPVAGDAGQPLSRRMSRSRDLDAPYGARGGRG